jgi:hypothetical protein
VSLAREPSVLARWTIADSDFATRQAIMPDTPAVCTMAHSPPARGEARAAPPAAPPATRRALGGRLGIPALGPHAMGPRGPEARAHLSGPAQMRKPSAPMRGGQASRAANGGGHGEAAQKTIRFLLSTAQRGELLSTPALVARQFGRVD